MQARLRPILAVLLATPLAACIVEPIDGVEPTFETADESAALNSCPKWGCGANAASMGAGIVFHELDASGRLANDVDVKITSFTSAAGAPLTLKIVEDELQGVERNGVIRRGRALNGSIIRLEHPRARFSLRIDDVSETEYWVGIRPDVPTYLFRYREDGARDRWFPLCEGLGLGNDHQWDGIQQIALVFRGDRYDATRKLVTATGAAVGAWFNIACAGTTPAKLHLLRHTEAGSDATHQTTVLQRQAMLKMLTADYCGRGTSFTVDGHPLKYMDATGWYTFDPRQVRSMESIWSPWGAVCLDTPRREGIVPTIRTDIARECGALPPSCGARFASWTTYGHVLSANP